MSEWIEIDPDDTSTWPTEHELVWVTVIEFGGYSVKRCRFGYEQDPYYRPVFIVTSNGERPYGLKREARKAIAWRPVEEQPEPYHPEDSDD